MKRGFTLIELIIVISVIAILAGIVTPLIGSIMEQARISRMTAEINTLCTAIAGYNQKYNRYPVGNITGLTLPAGTIAVNLPAVSGGTTTNSATANPTTVAQFNSLVGSGTSGGLISPFLAKRIVSDPFGIPYFYYYDNHVAAVGLGVVGSYGPNMTVNGTFVTTAVAATSLMYQGRVDTASIGDDFYTAFYKR